MWVGDVIVGWWYIVFSSLCVCGTVGVSVGCTCDMCGV